MSEPDRPIPTEKNVAFALIRRAVTPDSYSELDEPDSMVAKLARSRGKATLLRELPRGESGSSGGSSSSSGGYQPRRYLMEVTEGRLKAPTGYVMRFVEPDLTWLSPFDAVAVSEMQEYPATESILDSLPMDVVKELYAYGYTAIRGNYDSEHSRWDNVSQGWELETEADPWSRIMDVIDKFDSPTAALDYVYVNEGPDEWDAERVSEKRGIGEKSVQNNVARMEEKVEEK